MDINANICLLSLLYRDVQAYVACIAALERQGLACTYWLIVSCILIVSIIISIVAAFAMHCQGKGNTCCHGDRDQVIQEALKAMQAVGTLLLLHILSSRDTAHAGCTPTPQDLQEPTLSDSKHD